MSDREAVPSPTGLPTVSGVVTPAVSAAGPFSNPPNGLTFTVVPVVSGGGGGGGGGNDTYAHPIG